MSRRFARCTAAAAAITLVLSGCASAVGTTGGETRYVAGDGSTVLLAPSERQPARTIAGTTLDGKALDLTSLRGNVVVVNFWASWCPPCRSEAAALDATSTKQKANGVKFVGIVTRDSKENALAFGRTFPVSYPSLIDGQDNSLLLVFRGSLPVAATPTTYVLDRQGRIAARALGEVDISRLMGMIEPVLAEKTG